MSQRFGLPVEWIEQKNFSAAARSFNVELAVEMIGVGSMAVLRSPELYGFALAALAGTAWQQAAFPAGALTASLPTLTVTEPMVGSILGVVVLGETLHPGRAGWAVLVVTVAVMVVATARLARVEADSVEHADDPVPADGAG